MSGVRAVQWSENAKVGRASVTYATQATCIDCPLKGNGCYAENGPLGFLTRRMNREAEGATTYDLAKAEADAIDGLKAQGQGLRIHGVGDAPTNRAAKAISAAARRFAKRGGGKAWSYTHAWRRVARQSWAGVSILASCETTGQVREAHARGYATAIVVDRFRSAAAYTVDGVKLLPCPSMTKGVTCVSCGLCMNADRLHAAGLTIAFEAHGARQNTMRRSLALVS